jgi:hypothetical protein
MSLPAYFRITKHFLKSARAILLCLPKNDPEAINRLDFYMRVLLENSADMDFGRIVRVLITKSDLEWAFNKQEMQENLERWGLKSAEVSLSGEKLREEIEDVLEELVREEQGEGEDRKSTEESREEERKTEGEEEMRKPICYCF